MSPENSWASMSHLYAMSSSRVFKKLLSCHVTSLIRSPFLVGSRVLFWQAFLFWTGFPGWTRKASLLHFCSFVLPFVLHLVSLQRWLASLSICELISAHL
ncbi:hypothetical protein RchiOBHm_Chr0c03g0497861 [Rosa chinensis]|uniref:Uncharacterized protein n=1 Tax=Rosa chinensis TaxID=74649 RepID=A0A2P6SQW3_ROSCH|nr:hypothetical protein RchiOBHm_Chr0c03g0497861 [Rosa chinensis]